MPDENRRAEFDRECRRYTSAAQEVIAQGAWLATGLGTGHADLACALQHVSYAVQDFTSVMGTQALGQAFATVQNTGGTIQRDNTDRDQNRDQDREQVQDIRDEAANVQVQVRGVNDEAANANAWEVDRNAKNPESGQAKDETQAQAQTDRADPSATLGEILKQQDRMLRMSRNTAANQVKARALMARLGDRIDQLGARQRQLQGDWRRLRMEGQNRTYQNMGGN